MEKEHSITLDQISKLDKKPGQKTVKELQVSEMSTGYSKKLRGRLITSDPTNPQLKSPTTPQIHSKKTKSTPATAEKKKENEDLSVPKLNSSIVEKFTCKSELGEFKLPPTASKNFFKVGPCYQCKRKRFVFQSFANYMPTNCQKMFCAECLEVYYGEDIHDIIQTRTHWSTPFKRKICRTPAAILAQDSSGLKPESQTELEEKVYIVDTFLKSQVKKMLDLNSVLMKKLEKNKKVLTVEEKILGLKIIHDNLETLVRLKSAIQENKLKQKLATVDRKSYVPLINHVSNYLKKKRLEESKEKEDEEGIFNDRSLFFRDFNEENSDVLIRKRGFSDTQFEEMEESRNHQLKSNLPAYAQPVKKLSFQVRDE